MNIPQHGTDGTMSYAEALAKLHKGHIVGMHSAKNMVAAV